MAENDAVQRLKELAARLHREYRDDPNVKAVGWGLPMRSGKLNDGPCLIFYVHRKLPTERLIEAHASTPIPDEIEGFPTDVQVDTSRPASAGQRDETKFDPLLGGVATSNSEGNIYWFNGSGTLGVLARDNATNAPVALSNWHVWAEDGSEGDQIIQPGHPTGGDHVEAVGKVLACGPLLTSLIEWEAPSPLAAGLYAGAAAAAIAAAASDYRDPIRRGQDNTLPEPGDLTEREWVDMAIEYANLPLPGVPFRTDVKWAYRRETTNAVLGHDVSETRVNTQFLLGKMIATDKTSYLPGEWVELTAAIWDYQPRACDSYHVVAHLIPHSAPDTALRAVLHPTACPRTFPHDPPGNGETQRLCVDFDDYPVGSYPYKGAFAWLGYFDPAQLAVQVVDWAGPDQGLLVPQNRLVLTHEPASRVIVDVMHFNQPVRLEAYNAAGVRVADATSPGDQGVTHQLELVGDGIVRVIVSGGGGEGLILRYCIHAVREDGFVAHVGEELASSVHFEIPSLAFKGHELEAIRCCFSGAVQLPPDEEPGRWDVHLTVQNVNNVPDGTPPEEAAKVIGGHLLSRHGNAEVLGCTTIMLLDHAFDVI